MTHTGGVETYWNIAVEGGKAPSAVNLIWSEYCEEYDYTHKSAAVAYARELVSDGYVARVYRTSEVRKYRDGVRCASEITNQEVSL